MKELALLMFFVGCGYALAKLIERFSPADGRRIFFAIPSQASFNVLWGFVFYLGFAALVIHHHHWLRLLFALTAVWELSCIAGNCSAPSVPRRDENLPAAWKKPSSASSRKTGVLTEAIPAPKLCRFSVCPPPRLPTARCRHKE